MSKLRNTYFVYLLFISLFGGLLVVWGLFQFSGYEQKLHFILILVLAAVAQIATTSVPVSERGGITFEVSTAISMAVIPFYGPAAAVVVVATSNISVWLIKAVDKSTWRRSWEQLAFNIGMSSVAIFGAGLVFLLVRNLLGSDTLLGQTIPWLLAAIVDDQLNIWLLIVILRLQHGQEINPLSIWNENRWAMPINILVMSVGGGLLAFAVQWFGWVGIIIFFLPIVLSAYAFRLYVRQMQAHMDNLEAIVAERTKELAELMKEKDAFLAVLTHDMKTPLTSINIYGSLIRNYPHLAQERPHMVETILRSQKVLTDIVNNILYLERLQASSAMPVEKEDFDLALLIASVVKPLEAQATNKGISLQHQSGSQPILVNADPQQIERIIQNLISNAIKYTPTGGTVCIRAQIKNDHSVVVDVKDTGYGIPVEELPYVFDRFRRVAKHKNVAAGTGLGLAITKALVEAHGGEITVTSEEGVGSTFTVKFPVE